MNKLKLYFVLMLSAFMMFSCTAHTFASDVKIEILNDDFSKLTSIPSGWDLGNTGITSIQNNALVIDKVDNTSPDYYLQRTFGSVSGEFTLEIEFGELNLSNGMNLLFIYSSKGIIGSLYLHRTGVIGLRNYAEGSNSGTPVKTMPFTEDVNNKRRIDGLYLKLDINTNAKTITIYDENGLVGDFPGFRDAACEDAIKILTGIQSDRYGRVELKRFAISKVNHRPNASNVTVSENAGVLSCGFTFSDVDGDGEGNHIYQWFYAFENSEDYMQIEGETSRSFLPYPELDGRKIKCSVIPVDSVGAQGDEVMSGNYISYDYIPPPEPPKVTAVWLTARGSSLVNNFTAESQTEIDYEKTEYLWYMSDSLFGEYQLINGETKKEMYVSAAWGAKFFKTAVKPVDIYGTTGEVSALSQAAIQDIEGIYENFETMTDPFKSALWQGKSNSSGGSIQVAADPLNANNRALQMIRDSNNGITMLDASFGDTGAAVDSFDIDVYIQMQPGKVSETIYMFAIGESQIIKVYKSGANLIASNNAAGGSASKAASDGMWHHIHGLIDKQNSKVSISINGGAPILENIPWRAQNLSTFMGIRSYLQGENYGTVYLDNLSIVPVGNDYTNDVLKDINNITLEYAAGGSANINGLDKDIILPSSGNDKSKIVWVSSNESVIDSSGKVYRPAQDKEDVNVKLTAYVIKGTVLQSKEFNVKVLRYFNDGEAVGYDKEMLKQYDNIVVQGDIVLPTSGENGTEFIWSSENSEIITDNGIVNRTEQNNTITMNVIIKRGNVSSNFAVKITVLKKTGNDFIVGGIISVSSQNLNNPKNNINDNNLNTYWSSNAADNAPVVEIDLGKKQNFTEMLIVEKGNNITGAEVYVSDNATQWKKAAQFDSIGEGNAVFAEMSETQGRYVKVVFSRKAGMAVCVAELRLFYHANSAISLDNDVKDFTLGFSGKVISDFTVETQLPSGTQIAWTSSNTNILRISDNTVKVNRPSGNDATVILTATFSNGEYTKKKAFSVVISGVSTNTGGGGGGGGNNIGIPVGFENVSSNETNESVEADHVFNDISSVSWAKEYIESLAKLGIMKGVGDGRFEPNRSVSREEFVAILMRSMNIAEGAYVSNFSDVQPEDWYSAYVGAAFELGIVNGKDVSFGVGEHILRQDMAVMIFRFMNIQGLQLPSGGAEFTDRNSISDYAVEAVGALMEADIIHGTGSGEFMPMKGMTRAECAVVIAKMLAF